MLFLPFFVLFVLFPTERGAYSRHRCLEVFFRYCVNLDVVRVQIKPAFGLSGLANSAGAPFSALLKLELFCLRNPSDRLVHGISHKDDHITS
jgi:hypothetical protein